MNRINKNVIVVESLADKINLIPVWSNNSQFGAVFFIWDYLLFIDESSLLETEDKKMYAIPQEL